MFHSVVYSISKTGYQSKAISSQIESAICPLEPFNSCLIGYTFCQSSHLARRLMIKLSALHVPRPGTGVGRKGQAFGITNSN